MIEMNLRRCVMWRLGPGHAFGGGKSARAMARGQPEIVNVMGAQFYSNGVTVGAAEDTLRFKQARKIYINKPIQLQLLAVNDGKRNRTVI